MKRIIFFMAFLALILFLVFTPACKTGKEPVVEEGVVEEPVEEAVVEEVTDEPEEEVLDEPEAEEIEEETTAKDKIAFVSDRDGNGEIYIMNVDCSEQVRLTDNTAGDAFPSFSP